MTVEIETGLFPPVRSGAFVEEVPMKWLSGRCIRHPAAYVLRLEMLWDGVRDGRMAKYAHHVDVCDACLRPLDPLPHP